MATDPPARRRVPLRQLSPRRWPVRSRIAAVSAALTFVILVAFALVVGRLVSNQLTSDFREEVERGASELAASIRLEDTWQGRRLIVRDSPLLQEAVRSEGSAVRVVDGEGTPLRGSRTTPDLGPPSPRGTTRVGEYEVASRPIPTTLFGVPIFAQYGQNTESIDRTVGRLWLFLVGGVLGGTVLAALAGLAVAGRAMRPIASLTATTREIATTRDPSKRIARPESNDEVAELATTLDEMLRELDAARSESEHMIQLQREFVADASHELRTPLTSILANLELLQAGLERQAPGGEDAEIVDSALRSSRRMRLLVSDLLLLARADAGRAGARRDCDLARIAGSAFDEVRAFAADHELVLDAPTPVAVRGNPEELHRLALNLLENGVRHTPPGTIVRARVTDVGGRATLEVSDNGPGLPAGPRDQVFSRFFRGDGPADIAGDGGTGLGLAIVRAVAESHGGTVAAGDSSTGGARLTVTLPLLASPAPVVAGDVPTARR